MPILLEIENQEGAVTSLGSYVVSERTGIHFHVLISN